MKNRDSPYVFGELDDDNAPFVPRWEDTPPADGGQVTDETDEETVIVDGQAMSLRSYRRTLGLEEE